jgi:GntR family transcriptional regulator
MNITQSVVPLKSNELLSSQIYSYLRDLLAKGQFKPGSKLPSENELSRGLNVSRVSLRTALVRLELEGYIERKRGLGTLVIDRHPIHAEAGIEKLISMSDVIRARGHEPGTLETKIFVEPASEEIASKLNIPINEPVTVVNRVRSIDSRPAFWDSNRFPAKYFPPTTPPDQIGESLFKFSEQKLGLFISHAVARLLPGLADDFLAQKLNVAVGTLLITLDQVHYLTNDNPIWHSILSYPESTFSWYIIRTRSDEH